LRGGRVRVPPASGGRNEKERLERELFRKKKRGGGGKGGLVTFDPGGREGSNKKTKRGTLEEKRRLGKRSYGGEKSRRPAKKKSHIWRVRSTG